MRALSLSMVLLGLVCGHISGACEEQLQEEEKVYVSPENIFVHGKNIFVFLSQQWVAVEGLRSDKDGVYVEDSHWALPFQCRVCHRWNTAGRVSCKYCFTVRDDV